MDHVAIMNKSWNLIPKILSGEKSIESRWYQTRRAPWNKLKIGDKVFFKNSGEKIIAKARVSGVKQFNIGSLEEAVDIIDRYGKDICLVEANPSKWAKLPKYCILINLEKPEELTRPFPVNKKGFGSAVAWISISNIEEIKLL